MKKLLCMLSLASALLPAAAAEQQRLRVQIEHLGRIQQFLVLSGELFESLTLIPYMKDCTAAGELLPDDLRTGVTLNVQALGETNEGTIFTLGLHIVELVKMRSVKATSRCTIDMPITHSINADALSVTLRPGEKKTLQPLDLNLKPYTVTVERL